jgi:hypothetical protein
MDDALRADRVGPKRLMLRSMEARRLRKSRVPAKKFVVFRFRTNALLSWASFLFPNRVGISTKNTEKVDRFYGTLGSQLGGFTMRKVLLATTSICGLLFVQGVPARADADLDARAKDPKQWVMQQGDDANTRYSKLNQINATNVKKLQVAWTFSTGVLRGHEGGPLVVGDTMYVHTPFPNTVYALDLNNEGKILWKYEPRQDPNVIPIMCCDTVNRGVAYADGKIFLHQADTTLVALDAKTGKVDWSVMDGEAGKGQSGTDAPFVYKDKVLVGVSGGGSAPITSRTASSPGAAIPRGPTPTR